MSRTRIRELDAGVIDDCDGCPTDPNKANPGVCGCGINDDVFAPGCEAAIPTVSHWGMLVTALLLLTAAKIYRG